MDSSSQSPNKKLQKTPMMQFWAIAGDFAFLIAVPLLIFIYLGKWLDGKYNTNYFVIIGILAALLMSSVSIYKRIKTIAERLKRN